MTLIFLIKSYGFSMVLDGLIWPYTDLYRLKQKHKKVPKPLIYKDLGK